MYTLKKLWSFLLELLKQWTFWLFLGADAAAYLLGLFCPGFTLRSEFYWGLLALGFLAANFQIYLKREQALETKAKPILEIEFDNKEPYCFEKRRPGTAAHTMHRDDYNVCAFVRNRGDTVAKKCTGKIVEFKDQDKNPIKGFRPLLLDWLGEPPKQPVDINAGDGHPLCILQITRDVIAEVSETQVSETLVVKPHVMPPRPMQIMTASTGPQRFTQGKYYLCIAIFGENTESTSQWFRIEWPEGTDYNDLKMYKLAMS